jgi:hypothetical protein
VGVGRTLPVAIQTAFDRQPDLLSDKQVVVLEVHMPQLYVNTFSARIRLP